MDKLQILPYTLQDAEPLVAAAEADGHGVAAPTHVVFKGTQIIGYLSIGVVPTVLLWLDSKECHVRDSLIVMDYYEEYLKHHNVSGFLLPVPKTSPLQPYVEKVQYVLASPDTMIYFKQLIQTPTPHKGGQ
jgi:hypothetical protein